MTLRRVRIDEGGQVSVQARRHGGDLRGAIRLLLTVGLTFIAFAGFIPLPVVIGAVLISAIPGMLLAGAAVSALRKRKR